ncbi:pitrilysin family protein [Schumannella luteola]|uniref:Putative Zn-dependent peptidase n=1 Tax=Schumannella luteola TaxID=472059 RepID=A0A852YG71_9MICO|nr:pitrilysin family protein [Schumannella luteola]NYH00295.1 putative Zn-dependent peptidase [Schumannella luteola]TPW90695.1 insulinase family protein [Schumannella luteola]
MNRAVRLPLDLPELDVTAAGGSRVRRSVLPSGVRILSESVPGAQSATVGYWVAVGSRDETTGGFGSTHFLEHLLFKGTAERSALDIAVAFDAVGGENNALTAKEHTCYYAKVRDLDLEMAVTVLADMVTSSVLDAEEFESERGVILEELAMADDDPGDVAGERFVEAVLGAHPLGRPIGGSPESIRAVGRDAVWQHYRRHYSPSELVITVAGAVDHDALVGWVERGLRAAGWDLDAAAAPAARRPFASALIERGSSLVVVDRPLEQVNLYVGTTGINGSDDRRSELGVLNAVLGGGMSSRLFQEIREKRGLAYSVYSYASAYSDAGVFGLYAGCAPRNAPEVVDLMLGQLRAIASDGITAEELTRARGQMAGGAALALEDSDTRMSRLGRSELGTGEFLDLDESLRRLDAVELADVERLAADLAERPLSLAAVGAVTENDFTGIAGLSDEPSAA